MGAEFNQAKWDPKTVLTTTAWWAWARLRRFFRARELAVVVKTNGTDFLTHGGNKMKITGSWTPFFFEVLSKFVRGKFHFWGTMF